MIRSFKCKETERLFNRQPVKKIPGPVQKTALRKLWMLDAAASLQDLHSPPGNRLEALKGDRQGRYSIRINDQFRICFVWQGTDAGDVEIIDYH
ncbi:MAG: type II toxin-antitoxin system RelE/ParE family toxin [Desulfobaccales bacterium]